MNKKEAENKDVALGILHVKADDLYNDLVQFMRASRSTNSSDFIKRLRDLESEVSQVRATISEIQELARDESMQKGS